MKRVRILALCHASGLALSRGIGELHDLSYQTIMLKIGLRLGIIRSS